MNSPSLPSTVRRLAITVRGIVQGVGFRPFVYNAAGSGELAGWVRNEVDTVQIEVEGETARLDAFLDALRNRHPPQAQIDSLQVTETTCQHDRAETFQIRHSGGRLFTKRPRPTVPADLATCRECLREIGDPHERRYGYPFTNCTNCGPRWSIIEQLPYDRPRTSMALFRMCPDCRAEYGEPADRRFHAQPIACPRCGPMLRLLDGSGQEAALGDEALRAAVEAVLAGRIVAVKGLGGFQLLADATSAEAVALLRRRKRRLDRPFALMVPSLDEARRRCEVSKEEARVLCSHEAPMRWQPWTTIAAVVLASGALAWWQYHEYLHERELARETLHRQSHSVMKALVGGIRSHRNRGRLFCGSIARIADGTCRGGRHTCRGRHIRRRWAGAIRR